MDAVLRLFDRNVRERIAKPESEASRERSKQGPGKPTHDLGRVSTPTARAQRTSRTREGSCMAGLGGKSSAELFSALSPPQSLKARF